MMQTKLLPDKGKDFIQKMINEKFQEIRRSLQRIGSGVQTQKDSAVGCQQVPQICQTG